jgi:hypothetical protein
MRIPSHASPDTVPCKVCRGPASLYGVVDFNRHCSEDRIGKLPLSGHGVYYRRCADCGFLFTDFLDDWTPAEFAAHIYNADYVRVDPDYAGARGRQNAQIVAATFPTNREGISLLDFGGGNSSLVTHLRDQGFAACDMFDPFSAEHGVLPGRKYNLVTCYEVLEHVTDPAGCVRMIAESLGEEGLVIFTTLIQPADFDRLGLSWWYAGPRNGHISLHSRRSLQLLWQAEGYTVLSRDQNLHIAFRTLPDFARHVVKT